MIYRDKLIHYGVVGMRWGHHKGGTGISRSEIRKDNEQAYYIGRNATIAGRSLAYGAKKTIKTEKKLEKAYAKDPKGQNKKTKKLLEKWKNESSALLNVAKINQDANKAVEQHRQKLIDKYGKTKVSDLKRKSMYNERMGAYSVLNERVNKRSSLPLRVLGNAASATAIATGQTHIAPLFPLPRSANAMGIHDYNYRKKQIKRGL